MADPCRHLAVAHARESYNFVARTALGAYPARLAETSMHVAVRKLGNSTGVIIPKSVLSELGLTAGDAVDLRLEGGRLVLAPVRRPTRVGWAEASRAVAEAGDDALTWPEFANAGDADLAW